MPPHVGRLERPRGSRPGLSALALLATAAVAAVPAVAQTRPAVRSATLSADVTADGEAAVFVAYELVGLGATREVDVTLLGFDPATATELLMADGVALPFRPDGGSRVRATVLLEERAAGDDRASLAFAYRVARAAVLGEGAMRVRIPVATLVMPPATDSGDVFHARVTLPDGWRVVEGFPTGISEREPGAHSADLRVVPSLVSMRGRTDGAWRPGLKLVIDLLTSVILVVVLAVGWRRMSEVAKGPSGTTA